MIRRFIIEIDDSTSDAEKEIEELIYRFGAEELIEITEKELLIDINSQE